MIESRQHNCFCLCDGRLKRLPRSVEVRSALAPHDIEDGLGEPTSLICVEGPGPKSCQLHLEKGGGVRLGLFWTACHGALILVALVMPANECHEGIDSSVSIAGTILGDQWLKHLEPSRTFGGLRGLEQHQRMHHGRRLACELQRGHSPIGVSDHVRTCYAQRLQERQGVLGLLFNAEWPRVRIAASETAPVIPDQLIPVFKDRLMREREEGVRHMTAVNEQDRLPFTMKLVF